MENTNSCCRFNRMIDCTENKCSNCGWNPDVAAKRIIEWKKNNKSIEKEDK